MFNIDLTASSYLVRNLNEDTNSIFSDIVVMPDAALHYESEDSLINNIKAGNIVSNNESLKDDEGSYIGWTYVADYKAHPLSRNEGKTYYIHIRINRDNKIEFGIFDNIVESAAFKTESLLYNKKTSNRFTYDLKIASKDEAERFLLTSDKKRIKLSALPKYAGYLNDYSEECQNDYIFSVFGNVWTYWYTVSNNTLYFCGFPLLVDTEEKGMIYDAEKNIIEANLPPTILNYKNKADSKIKLPLDLIYKIDEADDEHEYASGAKYILSVYGDSNEKTKVATLPIASIDKNKNLKNFIAEDVATTFDSYSILGGAYQSSEGIELVDASEININYREEECFEGNSGFYPFKTSFINKTGEDTFVQYKNAKRVNGFYPTIVNNNIQIIIGDSVHYLGNGAKIIVNNGDEWDIFIGGGGGGGYGGGGGGGWSTTLGPSGRDDDDHEVKRNTPPVVIHCGDIGYEYYTSVVTDPMIKTIPTYEVYGQRYRDADAAGLFEYDIDFAKLDEVVLEEGYGNIDDTKKNVLSKKLSRKLIITSLCEPESVGSWALSNSARVTFQNLFPLDNIEDNFYIGRDGAYSIIGGTTGPMAMTIDVSNENDSIKVLTKSCNREYDMQSNWGSGSITTDEYIYDNNNLKIAAKLQSTVRVREVLYESAGAAAVTNNKNLKVTNTLFMTTLKYPGSPEIVCSFHPSRSKCGSYNPKKISIRYGIRKVKLVPRLAFLHNIIIEYITKYCNDTGKLMSYAGDIEIKCGNRFISAYDKKSIQSEIVHVSSESRTIENGVKSDWTATSEGGNPKSKIKPFEASFKDIKVEILPSGHSYVTVADDNDDSDVSGDLCPLNIPNVMGTTWKGNPQLKLNFEVEQNLSRPAPALIPIIMAAYGNTWWESATENYQTDTLSHKFKVSIPAIYEPSNNKVVVEVLGNNSSSSYFLDSHYSQKGD